MESPKSALVYALNSRRLYWKLLELSLKSVRQFDSKIEIYVYAFGKPPKCASNLAERYRFKLRQSPALRGRLAAWTLKWRCVGEVPAETVLALDVDTYFYRSPQVLLRRYKKLDFYARKDIALGNDERHGPLLIRDRLNSSVYSQMAQSLDAKVLPVFNGSAMIWNNGSHRRWKKQLRTFERVAKMIQDHNSVLGVLKKDFFADEVAGALCLGRVKDLSWGYISPTQVTWYSEWKFKLVKSPGVLMHVSTAYAKDWAESELKDDALARELRELGRADKVRFLNPFKLKALR